MNSDSTVSISKLSGDPFSDAFAIDFEDHELFDRDTTTSSELHSKTACEKSTIAVPILDSLPHLTAWSSQSTISTRSTASSPVQEDFTSPIQWSNADLMYLLSCLLPDLLLTNTLFFSPPLEDLPTSSSPIRLRLFKKIPVVAPPPEAYSKIAPIGTGRPRSRILIAESGQCSSAEHARASLAKDLLSNEMFAAYMLDKYNVLATLYSSSNFTLLSLQRGMIEMLGVSDVEWYGRASQLYGQVDAACTLDARFEVFLLGVGRQETEEWVKTTEVARSMGEGDRRVWSEVYGEAAAFLWRAGGEMVDRW